jgi:hypothetical protein
MVRRAAGPHGIFEKAMHFSQLRSSVDASFDSVHEPERPILTVQMQGFIDIAIMREHVDSLAHHLQPAAPIGVLCDLRGVSGYAHGTSALAREWLARVQGAGVRRVALVAGSSVLRTAVRVIASELRLQLRCFNGIDSAQRWLRGESIGPQPELLA